ncbi:GAF domain-containing protein, partial [Streptomyces flaveolus]|uniref:GAF domain-containing protein n=1 Tax=Streptomyces flaveolus TaxID=67297 RepID=UPI003433A2D8
MESISAVGEHRSTPRSTPIRGTDLATILHCAIREAVQRLDAVAAVVYLMDEKRTELKAAMVGGSMPSVFTLPGRMDLEAPFASARAVASGKVEVLVDPGPGEADQAYMPRYPYVALAAPVIGAKHRFGAITVVGLESRTPCGAADRTGLQQIGEELAGALGELAGSGAVIAPEPTPVVVPLFGPKADTHTPGWGLPGVPGSVGTSLMYPLRRLAEVLNQATTMDHIIRAARSYVMSPFRAQSLVLAAASE